MSKFIQTMSTVALLMMIAGQPLWAASTKAELEKLQTEVQGLKEGPDCDAEGIGGYQEIAGTGRPGRPFETGLQTNRDQRWRRAFTG